MVTILLTKILGLKLQCKLSYSCEYTDAYILVKGTIDLLATTANENDKAQKKVAFKYNSPLRPYFKKLTVP